MRMPSQILAIHLKPKGFRFLAKSFNETFKLEDGYLDSSPTGTRTDDLNKLKDFRIDRYKDVMKKTKSDENHIENYHELDNYLISTPEVRIVRPITHEVEKFLE